MDDDENHELRQKLAHKPPGEPLSLAEIRELKKMETERVNRCIERGQRISRKCGSSFLPKDGVCLLADSWIAQRYGPPCCLHRRVPWTPSGVSGMS